MGAITSRLEKNDNVFRVEIPQEYVDKLGWRKGQILTLDIAESKLEVKKMQGFMGS
jgi:bifunctional DNA-binding transcriptional regulator/antitoxin component of YhaV-PrlF toxin-antitoxin module